MIEEKNEKYSTMNFKKEDPNMWSFDEDLMQNKKNLIKSETFFSKTER